MTRSRAFIVSLAGAAGLPALLAVLAPRGLAAEPLPQTAAVPAEVKPAPGAAAPKKTKKAPKPAPAVSASAAPSASADATPPASASAAPVALPPPSVALASSAPASVDPSALPECTDAEVDQLVRQLKAWTKRYRENEERVRAELGCDKPGVLCLDRFGEPPEGGLQGRVVAGQVFSVFVVFPATDKAKIFVSASVQAAIGETEGAAEGETLKVSAAPAVQDATCRLGSTAQREALRKAAVPIAKLGAGAWLEGLDVPADSATRTYWSSEGNAKLFADWNRWVNAQNGRPVPKFSSLRASIQVPYGERLSVDFRRIERGARNPSIEKRYRLAVDNGRYYVEPALLVPFVPNGDRRIVLTPAVGTSELRVGIEEDWHVTGAAMLQVFPLGRQRGQLTSFQYCRTPICIENWLGVQVGTGLGSPLREWYLGLVFEPVSGLNLDAGAQIRTADKSFYVNISSICETPRSCASHRSLSSVPRRATRAAPNTPQPPRWLACAITVTFPVLCRAITAGPGRTRPVVRRESPIRC
jgi:hypothetical protein